MSKPILLLNCGSSSIKYQVIDVSDEAVVAVGLIQRIGEDSGTLDHKVDGVNHHQDAVFPDHKAALDALVAMFAQVGPPLADVVAVGHRTVHGGEYFRESTLITDEIVEVLRKMSSLAPLHNPPGIAGIEAARTAIPGVPHVGIFDTAFFATLPAEAYTYAIDQEVAKQHQIRRYGFHGTSHSYVSQAAAEFLGRPYTELNQIVCHLGNGASISAIQGGKAIETSMGLTPLQGLVMGTRSGDVDPGLHAYLGRVLGYDVYEVDSFLNKKSGMLGMVGVSDFRDISALIEAGDERAKLAMDVYVHRIVGYIGSYLVHLGGHVDALVFTAGVGENGADVREYVTNRLEPLGFWLDKEANNVRAKQPTIISRPGSPVTVLTMPTNEELAMARETAAVVGI